ncbi:hypothetical protein F2Q68_00038661 [Brassica cretica]|uniref:Uncharacterized protein n=1 Tax=Brassica cretica TaxID=69181 RepID=A0A8S9MGZ4_BRACR|nr:hypothetical protein F2Q68_00038661 [Brassica cretica]
MKTGQIHGISVHKLLRKQVCLVEEAEAVGTEGRAEEAAVNFISGTGFQGSGNQGGNRNSYGNRVVKEEKLQEGDFEVADLAELTSQLREEKDYALAKEKEIRASNLKVRSQDETGTLAAAENVSLREQLEQREEEMCNLRCAAETFDAEKTMAVSGAIVVTHWELMREWLNHQNDNWDHEGALERYKMVKTSEAEF